MFCILFIRSWSPTGVFLAAKNSAKFVRDKKVINLCTSSHSLEKLCEIFQLVEIAAGKIMDQENLVRFGPERSPLPDVIFEGYFNRDSTKYVDLYRIPEADTVIRGTYRYKVSDGTGLVMDPTDNQAKT